MFFSDLEECLPGAACVWVTGFMAVSYCGFTVWNSAFRDPEVTWRPHRRGFNNSHRIPRAARYKHGSFRFLFPHRIRYQDQMESLLWEELKIPKE